MLLCVSMTRWLVMVPSLRVTFTAMLSKPTEVTTIAAGSEGEGPGLGVEVDETIFEKYPVIDGPGYVDKF